MKGEGKEHEEEGGAREKERKGGLWEEGEGKGGRRWTLSYRLTSLKATLLAELALADFFVDNFRNGE